MLEATSDFVDALAHRSPSAPADRWQHVLLLVLAISVPVLGALMTADLATGKVALPGLENHPLPTLCASRWLGLQCPTCGVTRSIIALMHGDVGGSYRLHRFGWLILLFIVAQVPYRTYRIVRPERRLPRLERLGIGLLLSIGILVVGDRFLKALGLF